MHLNWLLMAEREVGTSVGSVINPKTDWFPAPPTRGHKDRSLLATKGTISIIFMQLRDRTYIEGSLVVLL